MFVLLLCVYCVLSILVPDDWRASVHDRFKLGYYLTTGHGGTKRDVPTGIGWYEKAAAGGNVRHLSVSFALSSSSRSPLSPFHHSPPRLRFHKLEDIAAGSARRLICIQLAARSLAVHSI